MRTIIYLFFSLFIAVSVEAQRVSSFFIIMPDELLPQIETNRRKDMIDLFQHSQKGGITNSLGGRSDVTALSDNYISVGLSSSSTMQIKLLPLKGKEETVPAVSPPPRLPNACLLPPLSPEIRRKRMLFPPRQKCLKVRSSVRRKG